MFELLSCFFTWQVLPLRMGIPFSLLMLALGWANLNHPTFKAIPSSARDCIARALSILSRNRLHWHRNIIYVWTR